MASKKVLQLSRRILKINDLLLAGLSARDFRVHSGQRTNHSITLTLPQMEKLMKYQIRITNTILIILLFATTTVASALEVMVNEVPLQYEESGSGDVVLFVHGAISDRRVWSKYKEIISAERRFIAYDQRHFGESTTEDENAVFSADAHAEDLIGFIEALDIGPVSLVSWSYGGDIAARAAIKRPDLFRALVYYEPDVNGLIAGLPGAERASNDLYNRFGPAMEAIEKGDLSAAALHFIDIVFLLPSGGANEEPEAWKSVWQENGRTLPAYLAAPAGEIATCKGLSLIQVPTLVVTGSEGHVYDAMMAERVVECQPLALLATMQGVNHDGPYRKPEHFAEKIHNFLELVLE